MQGHFTNRKYTGKLQKTSSDTTSITRGVRSNLLTWTPDNNIARSKGLKSCVNMCDPLSREAAIAAENSRSKCAEFADDFQFQAFHIKSAIERIATTTLKPDPLRREPRSA